ncbi:MAG: uncharacterized protein QOI16_1375 [Pseudonocardiales bacterium]|nr:uncharacterized protein [Pseudonocardiales bacterium]
MILWSNRGGGPACVSRCARGPTLVLAGAPVQDALCDLARLMAAFHTRAVGGPGITIDGRAKALGRRWRANIDEFSDYQGALLPDGLVDDIGSVATRFVDGHGDLIADDIFCLPDGPRVLDCPDFDDHLRHVDALDDVAFLAMDLERLGHAELGTIFLDVYAEFSGDPAPASLRHHYIAYRALLRAKVGHACATTRPVRTPMPRPRLGTRCWRSSVAFPEPASPPSRAL